jgi:hypothetical protein
MKHRHVDLCQDCSHYGSGVKIGLAPGGKRFSGFTYGNNLNPPRVNYFPDMYIKTCSLFDI